ncbi:MAG TPA: methyltransferase domain-containing protein [Patescibacteria group bacterium]|nr:methyltransferase domain-containing protein [Patescibacteria group bacterium]
MRDLIKKYQDIFFYLQLTNNLTYCKSVLDVGCGNDSPIKNVKKTFKSEGVDVFAPAIAESKRKKIHDSYKKADLNNLGKYYKDNSFDATVALDVVEHFTKKKALKLIASMEKIAAKKIIILTPNGFVKQGEYGDNPYQRHFSGWTKEEFERMGYKVYGLRGPKCIRGEYATIKYKPWILWGLIVFLTEPLFYFWPQASFDLFAVKEK